MLRLRQRIVRVGVELVVVHVDAELARGAGVAVERLRDVVEGGGALEGVVRGDDEVWVLDDGFDGLVGGLGPGLRGAERVVAARGGLVDHFEADDDVGVRVCAVFLGHGDEDVGGVLEVVALLPFDGSSVAGVVLAVLAARRAVAVDPDVHACVAGPADGLVEECVCALEKGGVGVVVGPVADWNAESVEAV